MLCSAPSRLLGKLLWWWMSATKAQSVSFLFFSLLCYEWIRVREPVWLVFCYIFLLFFWILVHFKWSFFVSLKWAIFRWRASTAEFGSSTDSLRLWSRWRQWLAWLHRKHGQELPLRQQKRRARSANSDGKLIRFWILVLSGIFRGLFGVFVHYCVLWCLPCPLPTVASEAKSQLAQCQQPSPPPRWYRDSGSWLLQIGNKSD